MTTKYDHAFADGCQLSQKAIAFLEAAGGIPEVSLRTDKNGKKRVYVSYSVKVYGAGSREWIARKTQYIGSPTAKRSEFQIEIEAMFVMAVGALNKPAIRWCQERLSKSKKTVDV